MRKAFVSGATAVVAAAAVWFAPVPEMGVVALTPSPSPSPSVQIPSASPQNTSIPTKPAPSASGGSGKRSKQASPTECVTNTDKPFTPTKFGVFGKEYKTITVGVQDGAAGTPPLNKPYWVAWFDGSPRPGSDRGNVVLSTHTYGKGNALGNDLKRSAKEGDVWKLTDGNNVTCYEIVDVDYFKVEDYDENSDLIYDSQGPEEIAMVICWDKNWVTGDWDSRVVYTARKV